MKTYHKLKTEKSENAENWKTQGKPLRKLRKLENEGLKMSGPTEKWKLKTENWKAENWKLYKLKMPENFENWKVASDS